MAQRSMPRFGSQLQAHTKVHVFYIGGSAFLKFRLEYCKPGPKQRGSASIQCSEPTIEKDSTLKDKRCTKKSGILGVLIEKPGVHI